MKDNRVIGLIIEARMTSSRLPGKVLMRSAGVTLFEHLILRLKKVRNAHKIILATTTNTTDDQLVEVAKKNGINFFRGSELNVTERVLGAAKEHNVDLIVEITADNPIMDFEVIEQVIGLYLTNSFDYVANDITPSYPMGMNTRIFSTELLEKSFNNSTDPYEQEHVTSSILKHKNEIKICNLFSMLDQYMPNLELTVDEREDFELVNAIIENLFKEDETFSVKKIINFIKKNPELLEINKNTKRTAWKN